MISPNGDKWERLQRKDSFSTGLCRVMMLDQVKPMQILTCDGCHSHREANEEVFRADGEVVASVVLVVGG